MGLWILLILLSGIAFIAGYPREGAWLFIAAAIAAFAQALGLLGQ